MKFYFQTNDQHQFDILLGRASFCFLTLWRELIPKMSWIFLFWHNTSILYMKSVKMTTQKLFFSLESTRPWEMQLWKGKLPMYKTLSLLHSWIRWRNSCIYSHVYVFLTIINYFYQSISLLGVVSILLLLKSNREARKFNKLLLKFRKWWFWYILLAFLI